MNYISHLTFGAGAVHLARARCVWRERGSFGAGLVRLAQAQQSVSAHFGAFGAGAVRLARARCVWREFGAFGASQKSLIGRLQLTC